MTGAGPTPYPGVNLVLADLMSKAQAILGDRLIGIYLYGSLSSGDFDPRSSDIDVVVVTDGELPGQSVSELCRMHALIAATGSHWVSKLEVSYISQQALRRHDPANARHPHMKRGKSLTVEQHGSDWVIQRHIIREQGKVVAGPPGHTLIDPVEPDALRRAVLGILREWWTPLVENPTELYSPGFRAFAVLTMCRALYARQYGAIVSKPAAALWAREVLGESWAGLIEQALAGRDDPEWGKVSETLEFIRYVLERSEQPGTSRPAINGTPASMDSGDPSEPGD